MAATNVWDVPKPLKTGSYADGFWVGSQHPVHYRRTFYVQGTMELLDAVNSIAQMEKCIPPFLYSAVTLMEDGDKVLPVHWWCRFVEKQAPYALLGCLPGAIKFWYLGDDEMPPKSMYVPRLCNGGPWMYRKGTEGIEQMLEEEDIRLYFPSLPLMRRSEEVSGAAADA